MENFNQQLGRIVTDLEQTQTRYALIGSLADSVRATPQPATAFSFAVATKNPDQVRMVVDRLVETQRYKLSDADAKNVQSLLGKKPVVTLDAKMWGKEAAPINLVFSHYGVEPTVVRSATFEHVCPGVRCLVANRSDLLAMADTDRLRSRGAAWAQQRCSKLLDAMQPGEHKRANRMVEEIDLWKKQKNSGLWKNIKRQPELEARL